MAYSDGYKVSGVFAGNFDGERIKRNAFHDMNILVIDLKDPMLTWDQREMLKQVGEKYYGKMKATA